MNRRKSRKQPDGLRAKRRLHRPDAGAIFKPKNVVQLTCEDWCFVNASRYHCSETEKAHFLEYEYARESIAYGRNFRSAGLWRQIFAERFPHEPFLSINSVERSKLLQEAFTGSAGESPLFDFTNSARGLSYQFGYSLKPAYQDRFEALAEESREELSLVQPQKSFEEAISKFKQALPLEHSSLD